MDKLALQEIASAKLDSQKQNYLKQLTRPLDGMWESFVAAGKHYSLVHNGQDCGYCVINEHRKLLQFSLAGRLDPRPVFALVLSELNVSGAVVATFESHCLSLCMDHQSSVAVNALLYHVENERAVETAVFPPQTQFRLAQANDLEVAVEFGKETLGADPGWLTGYFRERVERAELFGLWQGCDLIATGECRVSDSQPPYADLGMIVSKQHRQKGLATTVLRQLIGLCGERGLRAICSTEHQNVHAQKAIAKAGFISHHRILEISF